MEILGNDKRHVYADALEALETIPDNSIGLNFLQTHHTILEKNFNGKIEKMGYRR
jgi:hypothetical protein